MEIFSIINYHNHDRKIYLSIWLPICCHLYVVGDWVPQWPG